MLWACFACATALTLVTLLLLAVAYELAGADSDDDQLAAWLRLFGDATGVVLLALVAFGLPCLIVATIADWLGSRGRA